MKDKINNLLWCLPLALVNYLFLSFHLDDTSSLAIAWLCYVLDVRITNLKDENIKLQNELLEWKKEQQKK